MRILVVCQYYYPENVVISPICEELVRRGHSVLVVTGKPNYGFGKILPGYEKITDETINGVRVHRCNLVPRGESKKSLIANYLSFNRNSKKFIRSLQEDFDFVYSMEMSPVIAVQCANIFAKRHHIPHLLHCLDLWPESVVATGAFPRNSLAYWLLFFWSKKIYRDATRILVSSPSFERYFIEILKLNKDISFIPQPPLIPASNSLPIVYPTAYNFVYAGNVGRLQLIENFVLACESFKNRKDFSFHIIGNGTKALAVKELIKERNLEGVVHYHPMMTPAQVSSYLASATALVVPLANINSPVSRTIPNKLISSLYYGRPILGCLQGDGSIVLKRAGGAVFADEDPNDIAKAFAEIMAMPKEKLNRLGMNNKKYFEANFRFGKVIDQLEQEFKSVIKR